MVTRPTPTGTLSNSSLEQSQVTLPPKAEGEAERYDFLAPAQKADEIGRIGSYRVLKELGAGGMGVVFQAEDTLLGRQVALKAILPGLAGSATVRQRFLREARAAATLEHDHIVPIFEVGEDRGIPFIAMPLLKGEPLEERLRREPRLPLDLVLRIGREVALGLAVAHKHGLVHRDIKPANLWLEEGSGRVKILDFGLARAASDNAEFAPPGAIRAGATASDNVQLTQVGTLLGTPAYMAPEQAVGAPVDGRCDLFSLGCVLYRMCTGQLPFTGDSVQTILYAVIEKTPPVPRDLQGDMPPELSDLVMRLLAKEPAERPESADAVVQALAKIEARRVAEGSTHATGRAVGRPHPRRRTAVKAGLAFSAVALLAAVGVVLMNRGGEPAVNPDAASTPLGKIVTPGPGQTTPYIAPEPLELEPGAPSPAVGSMALVRQPAPLPGLRSWTIDVVPTRVVFALAFGPDGRQLLGAGSDGTIRIWETGKERPLRVLLGHDSGQISACWSPDGKYLASSGEDGTLRLWDPLAGRLLRTLVSPRSSGPVAWSPDGRLVATIGRSPHEVRLWDVAGLRKHKVLPSPDSRLPLSLAWSPDSKLLASGCESGSIAVWDVSTGTRLHDWTCDDAGRNVERAMFAPDGRLLAAAAGNRAYVWEIPSGSTVAKLDHKAPVLGLGWSPADRQLLTNTYDYRAHFWDPRSGKLLRTMKAPGVWGVFSPDGKIVAGGGYEGNFAVADLTTERPLATVAHRDQSNSAAWSPTGDHFALPHFHGGTTIWDARTGRLLRRLADAKQVNVSVAWSPTGKALAVAPLYLPHVQLWNPDTGAKLATLKGHTAGGNTIAWSRDGHFLATGGSDKTVRVWDGVSGKPLHTFTKHTAPIHAIGWSADGQTLASASADQTVRLWNTNKETPGQLYVFTEHKAPVLRLAWSPDGKTLVTFAGDASLIWWDPADGSVRYKHIVAAGQALAWSADGKVLVANTTLFHGQNAKALTGDASSEQLALAAEMGVAIRLQPFAGHVNALAFSPSGKTLLMAGSTGVQVLDMSSGRPRGVLLGLPEEGHLALTANGHWRGSPGVEKLLLYIAVTDTGQELHTPEEFSRKYGWRNEPENVRLLGE